MTEPTLPRELERAVFELAAWADQRMICTLPLVARRVNVWIGPLRYRMYRIPSSRDLEALWRHVETLPASAAHTTHFATTLRVPRIASRLARTFPNLVDLGLWGEPPFASDMRALQPLAHLRRLSLSPYNVFPETGAGVNFVPDFPPLTHLTHLELLGPAGHAGPWTPPLIAAACPALTHLSFMDQYLPDVMRDALGTLLRLAVCVYVHVPDADAAADAGGLEADAATYERQRAVIVAMDDPRAAALTRVDLDEDWETGAWGGRDYWACAEEEVARAAAEANSTHA
ncbi:hypothetical protein MIND_00583000 [Mycena indigotica]|uniref:Uncharacterized protein n=1 Tax=Mycena indigotica TaxID=2126181 RepID=A0A8H6SPN2_9AGAR|nr:uncharacterized protein MIND_00583000 [Mycena indigotica]KAF7303538.1 hypothetical protein MIND_00583000 [Mycena indigotica]